jgi:hypothetical protein
MVAISQWLQCCNDLRDDLGLEITSSCDGIKEGLSGQRRTLAALVRPSSGTALNLPGTKAELTAEHDPGGLLQ